MSAGRFEGKKNEEGALYHLLPEVVRERDRETGGQLLRDLQAFGARADAIEKAIADAYSNFFIETANPWFLPYIADLVGYRPIATTGLPSDADQTGAQQLRRDIGRTIWARRRKAAMHAIGDLVGALTGWRTAVFENGRTVVTTPSIRFAGGRVPMQGTPDVRKLLGRHRIDQGPGLVPCVATVGRIDGPQRQRRWHPLDVVVEVWPTRPRLVDRQPAGHRGLYWTFTATGTDVQLFVPTGDEMEIEDAFGGLRPLRVGDFLGERASALKESVYGPDKALCLYVRTPLGKPVPVGAASIAFGPIDGGRRLPLPGRALWIIDPERGRIEGPTRIAAGQLYVRYCHKISDPDLDAKKAIVLARLKEHVPLEARAGLIIRH